MHDKLSRIGVVAGVIAGSLALGLAATAPARADVVGQLTCNIAGGAGALIASSRNVSCTFLSAGAPPQLYNGTMKRLGVDIGSTTAGRLNYQVIALGTPVPGALQGSYIGSGASVTLGTGVGLDALIGGSGNTISLQPLATTVSTGTNINAGLAALQLSFAGLAEPPMMRRFHHHRRLSHLRRRHPYS